MFGLLHLPNLPLLAATTAGGLVWCRLYARPPNLITLAFAQGWLATLSLVALAPEWEHGLRIGPGYWSAE